MVNGVKAKVIVMPKAAVLDPQGNAVRDAMRHLGMPEVRSVRIGKYMEIEIEGQDRELESRLHQLCRDLLSNPVIEDYELQRTDVGGQRSEISGRKETPNSDKSRAGAQLRKTSRARHPKSKTKRTRLQSPRRPTARQARKTG
jgi:phosphoribosylformylglycinamidine synthase